MKKSGLFTKIFVYTMVLVLLLVSVTAALFSQQFMRFYRTLQTRQIVASYEPLVERIQRSNKSIAETAQVFYENNESFEFFIAGKDGEILFKTPNADTPENFDGDFFYVVHQDSDFSIIALTKTGLESFNRDLIVRAVLVLAAMLALSLACAFVFAQKVTKPVVSKLEEEIRRERELEKTQRYFFSAASHELKTPIAATSVLLEGMLANVGDYKDHPKYLRECLKMTDAQSETISAILELVSLSDGKIASVPEKLDIRSTIAHLLPTYQTLAEANGLRIALDIPNEQICLADPKMLQRALSNVILNAVQNTPKGGEIRVWSEPAERKTRLCVLNIGARIDEAILPKLFDPFYRADKARSRKDGRSGLGLAIVQKTLEAMNIAFALENAADGVLFWMDLPQT
ncbi:MAG: HAMP domain-containing histidine kinase [Clostridiales bacterium]|jgi:two-component system sensor histidine kinase VanS|nr:HAMP domain-containing histidine kinase [Clostridiales bacterium]